MRNIFLEKSYMKFNKGLDVNDKKEGLLKRLKDIESKNKDQLDAIKDQGEKQLDAIKDQGRKQLDAIEKQKENKQKTIEKDEIVYLEDKIDKLFETYPKFVTIQNKTLLRKLDFMNLIFSIFGKFTN